jgi:hypothetical protein
MKKWYCLIVLFATCLTQAVQAGSSFWNYYTTTTNTAENFAICLTRTNVFIADVQWPDKTSDVLPYRAMTYSWNVVRVIAGTEVPLVYIRNLTISSDNMRGTGPLMMPSYSRWVMLLMHVPLEELVEDTESLSEVDRFISERIYHPVNFDSTSGICIDWPEIDRRGEPDPRVDYITYAPAEVVEDLVEIAKVYNPETQGKNVTFEQVATLQAVLQTAFAQEVLQYLLQIHGNPPSPEE